MAEGEIIAICFHNNELSDCKEGERAIDRIYQYYIDSNRTINDEQREERVRRRREKPQTADRMKNSDKNDY